MSEEFCSHSSRAAAEPLAGTAACADIWIGVEVAHPWAEKPLASPAIPEHARQILAGWLSRPGSRLQLLARGGVESPGLTLMLGSSVPGHEWLIEFHLPNWAALADIDFAMACESGLHSGSRRIVEPVYWVCTHGKRDRCCAKWGTAVWSALCKHGGANTWQTSHLGGHRFAPTLLVLPLGLCYGRVEVADVASLVAKHDQGAIYDLERMRGRSAYPPHVQAAEKFLRQRTGDHSSPAWSLEGTTGTGADQWQVRFLNGQGRPLEIEIRAVESELRLGSCADDGTSRGVSFVPG